MCGRFLLFTSDDYEDLLSIIRDVELNNPTPQIDLYRKREVYPGDNAPIIIPSDGGSNSIILSKWGFPNFRSTSRLLINARSETLEEKPTFKNLISSRRCLIPALGFYEWKSCGSTKDKYFIRPKDTQYFYMAGLYHIFNDKSGTGNPSFVVITTTANDEMQSIHDRMPVILSSKSEALTWLDPKSNWSSEAKPLLSPYHNPLYLENQNPQIKFPV